MFIIQDVFVSLVLLLQLLASTSWGNTFETFVQLTMPEETGKGSFLASLSDSLPRELVDQVTFTPQNDYFHVKSNGAVLVNTRIDLEKVCTEHQVCCGKERCVLETDVVVSGSQGILGQIKLNVTVADINDQTPTFQAPYQNVYLTESAPIGHVLTILGAQDLDVNIENQIQHYKFTESSGTFELVQPSRGAPLGPPQLLLSKAIDFEKVNNYSGILSACDPRNCTQQQIYVHILDENDNVPVFPILTQSLEVPENCTVGTALIQVQAVDKDTAGDFGKVTYFFSSNLDSDLRSTFTLEGSNGTLFLARSLDASTRQSYDIRIRARDGVDQESATDMTIQLKVVDVNNFSPVISIMSPKGGQLEITENSAARVIGVFNAQDRDLNENGKVSCHLYPYGVRTFFELETAGTGVFSLKTTEPLDYEKNQTLHVAISCRDGGQPPRSVTEQLVVHVLDVNEFNPVFLTPSPVSASIPENSPEGTEVAHIQVKDDDLGAVIRFWIQEGTPYFQIEEETGLLKTGQRPLDREMQSRHELIVCVLDSLEGGRSASIRVAVTVEDVNDHAPIITARSVYEIPENQPPLTKVTTDGPLQFVDADLGENAVVDLRLVATWASNELIRLERSPFHLDSQNELETVEVLDREQYATYRLELEATDRGKPSMRSRRNFTIVVLDENDCRPEWRYPRGDSLNLTNVLSVGDLAFKARAYDADSGVHSQIRYRIHTQSPYEAFGINATSGNVVVLRDLTLGLFTLTLIAEDGGSEAAMLPRTNASPLSLRIHVLSSEKDRVNLTVLLLLVSVTLAISAILVLSIICVRKPRTSPLEDRGGVCTSSRNGGGSTSKSSMPLMMNGRASTMVWPMDSEAIFDIPPPSSSSYSGPRTPVLTSPLSSMSPGVYPAYETSTWIPPNEMLNVSPEQSSHARDGPGCQSLLLTSPAAPASSVSHSTGRPLQPSLGICTTAALLRLSPTTTTAASPGQIHISRPVSSSRHPWHQNEATTGHDGDSADSGRGASEDDSHLPQPPALLQHQPSLVPSGLTWHLWGHPNPASYDTNGMLSPLPFHGRQLSTATICRATPGSPSPHGHNSWDSMIVSYPSPLTSATLRRPPLQYQHPSGLTSIPSSDSHDSSVSTMKRQGSGDHRSAEQCSLLPKANYTSPCRTVSHRGPLSPNVTQKQDSAAHPGPTRKETTIL